MNIKYSLRDVQQDPVVAYCKLCKGEIYAEDAIMPGCLCEECFERLSNFEENRKKICHKKVQK